MASVPVKHHLQISCTLFAKL